LAKDRDYTADLKKLLASANVCSKRWVHEQYDTMVQTNTVIGPGGEAGVMRIKGTRDQRPGAGITSAGLPWRSTATAAGRISIPNSARCTRWPRLRARWPDRRNAGGRNQLPQLRQPGEAGDHGAAFAAIDGIARSLQALGTPITGGNVSLYNETRGEGIYPTPVLGIVGILDDVTKAVPADFQRAGDAILSAVAVPRGESPIPISKFPSPADQPLHQSIRSCREISHRADDVVPEDGRQHETPAAAELVAFGV
jgi:phosphoribosylformylglycinamidine (FGAM) synthase-like enzyme